MSAVADARVLPNSPARVLAASLIGTTIEFYDFYIYATAAVLVFPQLFFPESSEGAAVLQSLATFAVAFVARPFGSALFGHYGDRIGRKATLVAALLTMGISTVAIGLLPGHAQAGLLAPALLALCRFGQGLGLGGEWGGAVLLATENAPPGRRAWYGMFPQLGAPLGFLLSAGSFLALGQWLDEAQFLGWGWRLPFLGSALLVLVGLWVRLAIHETPDFQRARAAGAPVRLPLLDTLRHHGGTVLLGTLGGFATFVLFYLMTVFTLGHATRVLGYARQDFLLLQMFAVLFFAAGIPLAALYADRRSTLRAMGWATAGIFVFGLCLAPLFVAGQPLLAALMLVAGLFLMGLTYGPCGTLLAQLYPVQLRYTGASLSFNLAGVLGAAPAPYVATWLAGRYGLWAVGGYLCVVALATGLALWAIAARHPAARPADA